MADTALNTSDVLGIAPGICESLDLDVTLRAACEYANERFKTRHSALLLFSPDRTYGTVFAEAPADFGTVGTTIPVTGVAYEERLITEREPIAIEDVENETGLGPVRDILLSFGIRAILVLPIIGNEQVYGSFSIDILDGPRRFSEEDIKAGKQLADQIATAIATAEFFDHERLRAIQLEALRMTSLAINAEQDRAALLRAIVENAKRLFKTRSAGLYEYDQHSGVLTMIAECNGSHLSKQIHRGEGIAGRLMESGETHKIVADYAHWDGRAPAYRDDQTPFGAVMAVPVWWQGKPKGVLYVDDEPGRPFSNENAKLLGLYADQAAVALVKVETERRLELLLKVTNVVTAADNPSAGLQKLAEALLSEIRASFCRVLLLDDSSEKLVVRAAATRADADESPVWKPRIGMSMIVSEWNGLRTCLDMDHPIVIRRSRDEQRKVLDHFSELVDLFPLVNSMLLVPLRSGAQSVGLLTLGEQRSGPESQFTKIDIDLAEAVGAQLTTLVERLRHTERYHRSLQKLDEVSLRIRSEPNRKLSRTLRRRPA